MRIMIIYKVNRSTHLDMHPVNHEPEYYTSEVCDAMTDCEDCPYLSPNRVREIMRRISDGTTDANPSGPF